MRRFDVSYSAFNVVSVHEIRVVSLFAMHAELLGILVVLVSYEFECFARECRYLIATRHAVEETVSRVSVQISNEVFVSVFGRRVDWTANV